MAKLIKDLYPHVTIVFGGANYDGEMGLEYFRAFPFIDHVVVGEGEELFPALVRHILEGRSEDFPQGVAYREGDRICSLRTNGHSSPTSRRPVPPTMTITIISSPNWAMWSGASIVFCSTKVRAAVGGGKNITVRFAD